MSDLESKIDLRRRELGIDKLGLKSIRNFIDAAFYHVRLEGMLPADKHLVYNTAIRHATNRIACQGRHGVSRKMSRVMSLGAINLRQEILADHSLPSVRSKTAEWLRLVTEEHQDPVAAVEAWIKKKLGNITVDAVLGRLLDHPSVIVTRDEAKQILGKHRHTGSPAERYDAAKIEIQIVEEGAFAFFRSRLTPGRQPSPGKYYVDRMEDDC